MKKMWVSWRTTSLDGDEKTKIRYRNEPSIGRARNSPSDDHLWVRFSLCQQRRLLPLVVAVQVPTFPRCRDRFYWDSSLCRPNRDSRPAMKIFRPIPSGVLVHRRRRLPRRIRRSARRFRDELSGPIPWVPSFHLRPDGWPPSGCWRRSCWWPASIAVDDVVAMDAAAVEASPICWGGTRLNHIPV